MPFSSDTDEPLSTTEVQGNVGRNLIEAKLRQKIYVEHFTAGNAGAVLENEEAGNFGYTAHANDGNVYGPFTSALDWEVAKWIKLQGPSSNACTELLQIPGFAQKLGLSYDTSNRLNILVDALPSLRPRFKRGKVTVQDETFYVYFRDIIPCVQALYGHAKFAAHLIFKPERHYADPDHTIRMYSEMHTGKWWWSIQSQLEQDSPGATVIPIIISTDKTQVTTWGGKQAYPVYMTIGNIPKDIRRKPSHGSQILLAYLPTDKLEHLSNASARRRILLNIMHKCLKDILAPLRDAGEVGIPMASGDGIVRRCHPIFAADACDYLEQIATVGCKMGECPTCQVPPHNLGDNKKYPLRELEKILDALHTIDTEPEHFLQACKNIGIKPIIHPFWEDLPYCDIHLCITSDILHQLLQGLIKHLTNWIKSAFDDHELDARCQALPPNSHVRQFFKGITPLSKITGHEHHDIARILLGLIIDMKLPDGLSNIKLLKATRAMLDFLYLAEYPVHSTESLGLLQDALDRFHENKDIFVQLGIRKDFNLPKLHFLMHYMDSIKWLGTLDNFNTEYTERLHIDFAKDAYAATNHKDELPQMTLWLERKEKVLQFHEYITWHLKGRQSYDNISHATIPSSRISMTKHPSQRNVSFDTLQDKYGAMYIEDAIALYVAEHENPNASLDELKTIAQSTKLPFSKVHVFHKAKFWLGHFEQHPLSANEFDIVYAKPKRKNSKGDMVPSRFDTVLVNQGHATSVGIAGHRAAQVRAIFQIPHQAAQQIYKSHIPIPRYYAYVEWFSKFESMPNPYHGLYSLKRTIIKDDRIAAVIPIGYIQRSIHLFPAFDTNIGQIWKASNVLEKCDLFYLNCFSDRHAYHHLT
ncbi:hypothetical protein PHLGIDRAFT_79255 [Phlebiopsis gigantea 11061_1 CR5-6]|uniref:Uncharacterized protein n=1 Tax=Phlebiopsis gigantea (strain 11061_1 CR5-6) TaxID=745531 RepID=A0A0C3RQZ1_PHLG1|nr:hypothetical protein PHLGIDRAFT_79255 [Phlebiopsis gigantea 11061_1 CR5-6]